MKRRIRKVVNFFALNLLFFALYLNFIHKDKSATDIAPVQTNNVAANTNGTILVQNPEKYLVKKNVSSETKTSQQTGRTAIN